MLFIAGANIKKRKKIHKVFSGKSESNIRKSSEGILKAERNTRIIVKNISINRRTCKKLCLAKYL